MKKMQANVRRWMALLLLWALCAAANAQLVDTTPPSEAQRLACLVRPASPEYPARDKYDDVPGFMRVQLRFSKPDEAPAIEVLANTARQNMQDVAFRYLRGMRLPCLQPADGTVQAVQEFDFRNSPVEPLPMDPVRNSARMCIVTPRTDLPSMNYAPVHPEQVVVTLVFNGDGEQPPEVRIIHSTASRRFEKVVLERVADYRMPCRKAGDAPLAASQFFTFAASDQSRHVLKRKVFGLTEFLAMTEGAATLKADFDLSTMGCPFKLNYRILGPSLPNEASAGKPDPNKLAFVRWIEARQLDFKDKDLTNDLFGEVIQINVPCGHLKLDPASAAPAAAASAGG